MAVESFYLTKNQIEKIDRHKSFWKRQFQTEITTNQRIFDGLFGIVLPVICFFFDPIVFKRQIWGMGNPFLADYKPFAYILSFVSIMSLLAFIIWGAKLKWLNSFLSGLFAVGAIISLIIGVFLFPLSLFGLIILIGALGFTPLLTAFVYWRNAVLAYKTATPLLSKSLLINSLFLSAIFSLVLPYLANVKIKNATEIMLNGDAQTIKSMGRKLKFVAPLVNFSALATRYRTDYRDNSEKGFAIAEVYKNLSGEDIKYEANVLGEY